MLKRRPYFDYLRGLAIMMVVGIHTYARPSQIDECDMSLLVRQVLNCAVPLFLAISGFFCFLKPLTNKQNYLLFLRRQIPKIYIPTMLWSLPLLVVALYNGKSLVNELLLMALCGYSIYYFIALTIQYYLLLPVFHHMSVDKNWRMSFCSIISLLAIITITWFRIIKHWNLPLIVYAGNFPLWILFYALGCRYSKASNIKFPLFAIIISLIGLVLSYTESVFLINNYGHGVGIKPTSFLFSSAVVVVCLSPFMEKAYDANRICLCKIIEYMGKESFAIYLIHCYLIAVLPINSYPWILRWFLSLICTLLFLFVIKKITPNSVHYYLGIYD